MKRPLIPIQAKDPVGARGNAPIARQRMPDNTFLGGYSDVREQIDTAIREGKTPTTGMNYRFHWVTTQRASGRPDGTKAAQFSAMGYRQVKFDEASSLGITLQPHMYKSADGGVQNGDTQLYYCDAETAEQHLLDGRQAIDDQTADEATSGTLHSAGSGIRSVGGDLTTSHTEHTREVLKG